MERFEDFVRVLHEKAAKGEEIAVLRSHLPTGSLESLGREGWIIADCGESIIFTRPSNMVEGSGKGKVAGTGQNVRITHSKVVGDGAQIIGIQHKTYNVINQSKADDTVARISTSLKSLYSRKTERRWGSEHIPLLPRVVQLKDFRVPFENLFDQSPSERLCNNRFLLVGGSGCGKSFACEQLAHLWSVGEQSWTKRVKIVLYFSLMEMSVSFREHKTPIDQLSLLIFVLKEDEATCRDFLSKIDSSKILWVMDDLEKAWINAQYFQGVLCWLQALVEDKIPWINCVFITCSDVWVEKFPPKSWTSVSFSDLEASAMRKIVVDALLKRETLDQSKRVEKALTLEFMLEGVPAMFFSHPINVVLLCESGTAFKKTKDLNFYSLYQSAVRENCGKQWDALGHEVRACIRANNTELRFSKKFEKLPFLCDVESMLQPMHDSLSIFLVLESFTGMLTPSDISSLKVFWRSCDTQTCRRALALVSGNKELLEHAWIILELLLEGDLLFLSETLFGAIAPLLFSFSRPGSPQAAQWLNRFFLYQDADPGRLQGRCATVFRFCLDAGFRLRKRSEWDHEITFPQDEPMKEWLLFLWRGSVRPSWHFSRSKETISEWKGFSALLEIMPPALWVNLSQIDWSHDMLELLPSLQHRLWDLMLHRPSQREIVRCYLQSIDCIRAVQVIYDSDDIKSFAEMWAGKLCDEKLLVNVALRSKCVSESFLSWMKTDSATSFVECCMKIDREKMLDLCVSRLGGGVLLRLELNGSLGSERAFDFMWTVLCKRWKRDDLDPDICTVLRNLATSISPETANCCVKLALSVNHIGLIPIFEQVLGESQWRVLKTKSMEELVDLEKVISTSSPNQSALLCEQAIRECASFRTAVGTGNRQQVEQFLHIGFSGDLGIDVALRRNQCELVDLLARHGANLEISLLEYLNAPQHIKECYPMRGEKGGHVKTQLPSKLKVVMMGASGVGKTALVCRFCEERFVKTHVPTIAVDFLTRKLILPMDDVSNSTEVTFQIWDTAGQERFRSLSSQYMRNSDCIVLAYELGSETIGLDSISWWEQLIQKDCPESLILLVANKRDLVGVPDDVQRSGILYAAERGWMFWCCSSLKDDQSIIDRIFVNIARKVSEMALVRDTAGINLNDAVLAVQEAISSRENACPCSGVPSYSTGNLAISEVFAE